MTVELEAKVRGDEQQKSKEETDSGEIAGRPRWKWTGNFEKYYLRTYLCCNQGDLLHRR